MIRTLIVDDEPLARSIVARMLAAHADLAIVGESGSGPAAVRDIRRLSPDLVLLDVQMPGLNGFGVLRELSPAEIPAIVFVTAYDDYALDAFGVHAVDYVLKPIDEQRLESAIERARRHLRPRARTEESRRIEALIREISRPPAYAERLVVKSAGRILLLPVAEVDWIEADGKLLNVRTGAVTHTLRRQLSRVAGLLDPAQFLRISRSAIINLSSVREIRPSLRGEFAITMNDGTTLTTTRSYRDGILRLLDAGA